MDKQLNRKKWVDLLEAVSQLEIKGQVNVVLMYKIIAFLQKEISEIDNSE